MRVAAAAARMYPRKGRIKSSPGAPVQNPLVPRVAEFFSANRAVTTVTSGGTDAPPSGSGATWTVASSAMFSATATGLSQFHVADPAAPSEMIAVTNVNGTTWTVTRGAENTTPVAHSAGFTVYQVVTTGFLGAIPVTIYPVPPPTGATATDTAAIGAAISTLNAAGGNGTLMFRDGTYQVDSNALVIQNCSNFAVTSTGATIITQAPNRSGLANNVTGDLFIIADSTDFRVEGITFDGLRDTVAPITALTHSASSGQPSVTVANGQGARYLAGQYLTLFGGLGTGEQAQSDGFVIVASSPPPLLISSITPGGGSGGGDLITFTTNLGNSYTHVSGTVLSDGYGPYACTGAYLTPYQCGYHNTVAGRTLLGEDQQNGLHLLNCQRFTVSRVESRNIWESGIKMGTGFDSAPMSDACSQGMVSNCITYHGYDQGISVWLSNNITVEDCVSNSSGWAGISFSASDYCTASGNKILNSVYRVPIDYDDGNGIAVEGGRGNQIEGNVISGVYNSGIKLALSPSLFPLNAGTAPTTSTYLTAGTAAGTSIQVSSSTYLTAGTLCSIMDGLQSESLTIASVVDGTHVKFTTALEYSHAAGVYVTQRISLENVIAGNTITNTINGNCLETYLCVRSVIKNNIVTAWAPGVTAVFGICLSSLTSSATGQLPSGIYIGGDGSIVEGNIFTGAGGDSAILADYVSGIQLRGNKISGSFPNAYGSPGLLVYGVTDSIIADNVIHDLASQVGMKLATGGPSTATKTVRVTVTGNVIERLSDQSGIFANDADSLTISGNVVRSCSNGIELMGVTNSVVAGNITNSNQGSGILLDNDGSSVGSTGNRVIGNTARDDGSGYNIDTGGTWTQAYGIRETGNSNSNLYLGNECDSNGTSQIATVGAGSVTHYNILSGTISS